MYCPKCGCPEVIGDECPKCGVLISKHLVALERKKSQNTTEEAETLYKKAYKLHYISGDIEQARVLYTQVIERYPSTTQADRAKNHMENIRSNREMTNSSKDDDSYTLFDALSRSDTLAIDIYLWLSVIGGIILFIYALKVGTYKHNDGSTELEPLGVYLIAISFASVLVSIIFAGIAKDIRRIRIKTEKSK